MAERMVSGADHDRKDPLEQHGEEPVGIGQHDVVAAAAKHGEVLSGRRDVVEVIPNARRRRHVIEIALDKEDRKIGSSNIGPVTRASKLPRSWNSLRVEKSPPLTLE